MHTNTISCASGGHNSLHLQEYWDCLARIQRASRQPETFSRRRIHINLMYEKLSGLWIPFQMSLVRITVSTCKSRADTKAGTLAVSLYRNCHKSRKSIHHTTISSHNTCKLPIYLEGHGGWIPTGTHAWWLYRSCNSKNYDHFILSLIHIWRCRRYSLCRSRWSPYH